jgi:hypothetical protein
MSIVWLIMRMIGQNFVLKVVYKIGWEMTFDLYRSKKILFDSFSLILPMKFSDISIDTLYLKKQIIGLLYLIKNVLVD